jgi:HK97 gp10 family phage protein
MTDEFKAVQKALSKIPSTLQEKVVVGATRAAARVIANEAKDRVPVKTGLLKKSIGIAKAKRADTPNGVIRFYVVPKSKISIGSKVSVGGKSGKLKAKVNAYYAHMVEFGTSKMAAHPFLRPAFENSGDKSVKAFQEYALKRTEKELKKLAV